MLTKTKRNIHKKTIVKHRKNNKKTIKQRQSKKGGYNRIQRAKHTIKINGGDRKWFKWGKKTKKPDTSDNINTQKIKNYKSYTIPDDFINYLVAYNINRSDNNQNLELISTPNNSTSKPYVYKYTNDNKTIIIKICFGNEPQNEYRFSHVETEYYIYSYLTYLKRFNICDNIIAIYDAVKVIKEKSNYQKFLLFTESTDKKVLSLHDFINDIIRKNNNKTINDEVFKKIFSSIIFQLLYTLECLVRIKCKHNDLHTNNILVYIDEENIMNKADFTPTYDKYIIPSRNKTPEQEKLFKTKTPENSFSNSNKTKKTHSIFNSKCKIKKPKYKKNNKKQKNTKDKIFYVPNYGFTIKIYDFDKAILYNESNEPEIYDNIFFNKFNIFSNILPNEFYDMTKIINGIRSLINNDAVEYENKENRMLIYKNYLCEDVKINTKKNTKPTNNIVFEQIFENLKTLVNVEIIAADYIYKHMRNFRQFFKDIYIYIYNNTVSTSVYDGIIKLFSSIDYGFEDYTIEKEEIENTYDLNNITKVWQTYNTTTNNNIYESENNSEHGYGFESFDSSPKSPRPRRVPSQVKHSSRKLLLQSQNTLNKRQKIEFKFNDKLQFDYRTITYNPDATITDIMLNDDSTTQRSKDSLGSIKFQSSSQSGEQETRAQNGLHADISSV
jgi:hypothetical protein